MNRARADSKPQRITRLRLEQIRTDAGTQSRAAINDEAVADYAEGMIAGHRFPPIVVFHHKGDYILADGFHRLRARRLARFETIEAEVHQGTRLDAVKFSLSANHRHGLRRTNEDKRHAVEIALHEFPAWSDRAVANLCGVTHPSVGAVRRQVVNFTTCEKRLGRDGRRRKVVENPDRSITEVYSLPPRTENGENRGANDIANDIAMEIAAKLADLHTTLKTAVGRFPSERPVILALLRKVRADLAQMEQDIAWAGR
jgi:hypothetical protein